MSTWLISPTEPKELRSCGITSSLPETKGADILSYPQGQAFGVQRKTISDFIRSVEDGSLARELTALGELPFRVLILEGRPHFVGGKLAIPGRRIHKRKRGGEYTRETFKKMMFSIRYVKGVDVEETDSLGDTIWTLRLLDSYLSQAVHRSFLARPKLRGEWGITSKMERLMHILQGFDGVGVRIAKNMIDHSGGKLPLQWTISRDEMFSISRLSAGKIDKLYGLCGGMKD